MGNSFPNDNISYSSSSLPTAYQGLWATLSPTITSATAAALCPRPIRGCGQFFPNDDISYSSSSLSTAYQGLWATLSPTITSATAAALCPRPIRRCGQLFPQRQHQLQQQLFAHGLSGAVGNSFTNDNISYSSSSLTTAYQGLWATLSPTTTSATAAALCPRPIRGCGQFFPQRQHQLQQQLFVHALSGAVGNSFPHDNISYSSSSLSTAYQGLWAILSITTTSATAAALCPRPIRGCGQLFPQQQHQLQLQQQLFAHGLSGAVGNCSPNDNISYSSSFLPTAYQALWATLSPTTTSATATTAALCPRPIRGCGQFFPQRQHQLQQQLFAHGLSRAVGNSFPTTTSATTAALCPRPIRGWWQLFPQRQHQLQQQLFAHGLSGAVGNSSPNDNISYSSSSLPTAYQGLWATLSPTTTSATTAALFCPRPIRGWWQLFPNDNISYSYNSSSLPTAYQGLWATLPPTTTPATAAALCPRPIRGCGQLFPQRQHQLQQQLFAHGLSGAVGNSSPHDNISYNSSSLPTAYQGLWATLPPTTTPATTAALCPRPIRVCGQLFPQRQHQLQQQLFAHGLSGAVGNSSPNDNISYSSSSLPTAYQGLWATLSPTAISASATTAALCPRPIRGCGPFFPPTTTSASATTAALCPRPIRGCGQLFPQRQHQLQLQQQLFAHGLSGAVGNSSPNDNISYSSSSLPTAYQGLWATLSQRQHQLQLQQQLFAHGLSGAVGNSSPNDNISYSYNSSSLPTAYQGLWATLPPTTTPATTAALCPRPIRGCGQLFPQRQHQLQQQLFFAHGLSGAGGNSFPTTTSATATTAALCPRPIRGCGQLFPQRQHQLQQQLFAHGLSGAVGNSSPNDNISYSSSSLPTAYQGLWATLPPTTTSATTAALCPRPIRGCGQLFPQRQHQLQQQLFAHGLSGSVGNSSPNDNTSYNSSSLPTAYQGLWATLPPTTTSATAAALCPRPIRGCGQLFPNDNISYSSSSLTTAYQGLWATLSPTTTSATAAALCPRPIRGCGQFFPQRQHQLQQQLFVHALSGAVGNSFPHDNISYSSSSLSTAYQGLWAILSITTTSATAAALCPRPIRGCGQLFPQQQHQLQLQQQLFAHGLSGAVGNCSPNDNISYSSSFLPTAYQALWATLSPTTTSATATTAALCPRPIRGCGQFFPQRQHQLQQQLFAHGLSRAVGNSFPTTTSATTAALCPRPIRGWWQLFPQRQHQLQQQLFAHGLSGAVGNSSPNDNISYSSSSLPTAYQGLWATLSPTTTSATTAALFCPRPIRGWWQLFPNDNISYSYNSSSLPTAYQGLWATLPPTTTPATAAALCPRPIRGCGQLFPQRQHQLQQQLFAHGLSGAVGNSSPHDNISYNSSSLPTAYQGLWATLPPTTTSATTAALCPRPIRVCGQLFPQRQHQLQQQLFAHGLSGAVGNSSPNDNISYSSSSLPTAYQGLWATLSPTAISASATTAALCPRPIRGCGPFFPPTTTSASATTAALCPRPIRGCGQLFPQRQHQLQLQQQLFAHGLSGAVGNSSPNDNISYSSSSLPTAYQGLWATLSQRQHQLQLQQQLFAHGLSGAVGNSSPNDNISYSYNSSSLPTAYQGLWATLPPTTTPATTAALCPRPIRGCGQLFPQRQHQLQQQLFFAHGLSGAGGNSFPTTTSATATTAALCPRPIRGCGQLFPQRQHQLQQQLFAHGLSGAVGNSSPNDNISYSSSSLPTAYQGLWATLPPTTTSATTAALCPRPIRGCGQLFPQRQHQLQQQLFAHGLSGSVGNSSPNDNTSYNSSSLPTAYQGLWATLPPTTTSATAAALCPRPIRGCGQLFPQRQYQHQLQQQLFAHGLSGAVGHSSPQRQHQLQLQQQLFVHGLSGAVGNSSPNDKISYSYDSSSLPTAYQGLWATLPPTTTPATTAALCPRPIRGCGQLVPQRQDQLQLRQQLFGHGLSGAVGNCSPNDNISYSYSSSSLPTAYQGLWAILSPTTTSATAAALCPRPIRGCGQLFPQRQHQLQQQLFAHGLSGAVGNSFPNDNISYSSSSLSTAYQGLWATLSPTITSATAAALCPRPIRGCGQLFPQR